MGRVLFITGTDTGVGKTAVTAMLLVYAQSTGVKVRALKPLSAGGVGDEALISALQDGAFRVNFYHFAEPLAPWSAARLHNRALALDDVLAQIEPHRAQCDLLLIEGAGGLLSPLGENFSAADMITRLDCDVLLVAANRIGVLNHTLLTVEALRRRGVQRLNIALVEQSGADLSRKTNLSNLQTLLPDLTVTAIPHLSNFMADPVFIRAAASSLEKELAELLKHCP